MTLTIFSGDQTALSVAYGRNDMDIHWLAPRFNVPLTLPNHYIQHTCGADALYSQVAATDPSKVSFAHFIWGPKPCPGEAANPNFVNSCSKSNIFEWVARLHR